jgi:hypothetical protein
MEFCSNLTEDSGFEEEFWGIIFWFVIGEDLISKSEE